MITERMLSGRRTARGAIEAASKPVGREGTQ